MFPKMCSLSHKVTGNEKGSIRTLNLDCKPKQQNNQKPEVDELEFDSAGELVQIRIHSIVFEAFPSRNRSDNTAVARE